MINFWDPGSLHYVIDWSAWATFVVGIVAVVGAVKIGLRQADIAHRQAEIMERQSHIAAKQVEIERTRLQAELYDRRVAIYAGIEQYIGDASMQDGKIAIEVTDNLFKSQSVARFLLGQDVEKIAKQVFKTASLLRGDVGRLERLRDNEDEKRSELINKMESHHDRLGALHSELMETKEEYLRLSDVKSNEPSP